MPRETDYTLTEDELEKIEQVIERDGRPKVVRRAMCIRLLHLGYGPDEVAKLMRVGYSTLYKWHQRWREQGLAGLVDRPRSGRPRKADPVYLQALAETLEREPAAYGYAFAIWTVDRLAAHLANQTGIELSAERLRVLMQAQGYVYRRPKHDLTALQDADARAAALALLEELKKEPSMPISSSSLWTKRP